MLNLEKILVILISLAEAVVAQLVEQGTVDPRVAGSSPVHRPT